MLVRKLMLWAVIGVIGVAGLADARVLKVVPSGSASAGEQLVTIQAGIDAAANGDSVEVAPGTYSGAGNRDIDFKGKAIVVYGAGQAEVTVIDCGGTAGSHHGGFLFHTGETGESIVAGFTIINAYFATDGGIDTGAIHCVNASPVFIGTVIRNNTSHGVTTVGSAAPIFLFCFVSHNLGHGFAVGLDAGGTGGTMLSQVVVDHNRGAGVVFGWHNDSARTISSSTIVCNDSGGVRFVGVNSDPMVVDTVFTYLYANIIAYNRVAGLQKTGTYFPGVSMMCSDVFGNAVDWQNVFDATVDTTLMFSADPKFCDTAGGKFTLLTGSPCLAGPGNPCFTNIGALGSGPCTPTSCCLGTRGNVDCDGGQGVDISDLTALIDHMFISLNPLCCFDEANTDSAGEIDISDLTALIDHMFISLNPLPSCP